MSLNLKLKRTTSKDFLYCLYLEAEDKFYWGMTSRLLQRMEEHLENKTSSTYSDGKKYLYFVVPFSSREKTEEAEKEAWHYCSGGVSKDENGQATFPLYSGLVKNSSAVYRLLIKLGWDGERIELASFLEDDIQILHQWDEKISQNHQYLFAEEDFYPQKFAISNYFDSLPNGQIQNFHPRYDRQKRMEAKNKENIEIYHHVKNRNFSLIIYVLCRDSDGTESIATYLWRREKSLKDLIESFQSNYEFYILHFNVFEFDLFEDIESIQRNYQQTLNLATKRDWYWHLLQAGWTGRSMNLLLYKEFISTTQEMFQEIKESKLARKDKERLLMHYFKQLNKKPSLVTNKTDEYDCVVDALEMYRESLEESLSSILSIESQSKIIEKCMTRFSLSNTVNWRKLCFPEDWVSFFCNYCEQTLL